MDKSKIEHLNKDEYTHLPHAEQEFENHEQTDVAIRPLVLTLAAIAAVLVVSYVGLWGTFQLFEWHAQRGYSQVSNVEGGVRQVPENLPALQGVPAPEANPNTPSQDMDEFRQRNDRVMAGQMPMRDGLKPGMPIAQAMEQALSQKIFQTRPGQQGQEQPQGQSKQDQRGSAGNAGGGGTPGPTGGGPGGPGNPANAGAAGQER